MRPTVYYPAIGDRVVIEDVQSGSRDVIGMTGAITSLHPGYDDVPPRAVVATPFSETTTADVPATKVRPA